MGVGGRFGNSPGGRLRPGQPGTYSDVAPTPVINVDPPQRLEWRYPLLSAELRNHPTLGSVPIATLPIPAHDEEHVLERMVINQPVAGKVWVTVGGLDLPRNVVDWAPAAIQVSVFSDAEPIRLPPNAQLSVIWEGATGSDVPRCTASFQVRVEGL